jgi:RNA polymerase sigma factor (TIGR02999 family)
MSDVTRILSAIENGDPQAAEQLLPLVYDELRKLAAQKLARENPGQTLDATALVHEAYVRLVDTEKAQHGNSRGHFFAAAAEAMRRILVENARRKHQGKRGGGRRRVDLADVRPEYWSHHEEILAIDEALDRHAAEDSQAAQLVQLRYFGGQSIEAAAELLGISRSTAYEHWAYAKASLRMKLVRLVFKLPARRPHGLHAKHGMSNVGFRCVITPKMREGPGNRPSLHWTALALLNPD